MFANNFWFWVIVCLMLIGLMLRALQKERIAADERFVKNWTLEEKKKQLYPPMSDSDWEKLKEVVERGRGDFD